MSKATILITVLFAACPIYAQLKFEKTELICNAKPGQHEFKAVYKFKNVGDTTVTVLKTKSSCQCSAGEMKKKIFKPGETGELEMTMPFGVTKGQIRKKIYLYTKGDSKRFYELRIGANVPEYIKISPKYLKWKNGDPNVQKTIQIKIVHKTEIDIKSIKSSLPNWTVKKEVVKQGWAYKIHVQPRNTTTAERTVLTITLDFPEDKPLEYRLNARVAKPIPKTDQTWINNLFE